MLSIIKSMSLRGLEGYVINVQVDVSNGMPDWEIVGLPDASIKESKERVRTAIKNSGYELYSRKVLINLAPADIKKEGSFLDLPIAIGVLYSMGKINNRINKSDVGKTEILNYIKNKDTAFVGELSLNGTINRINGILPICIEAKKLGIKKIIIPVENLEEVSILDGITILGANNLDEVVEYLKGNNKLKEIKTTFENIKKPLNIYNIDFSDVNGNENAKRALEISAAGGHNILLIGSPGSGKTMLAKRLVTILPDLSFEESLETTKIHSIAGKLKDESLIISRPFRSPHHTITKTSLIGGGKYPKPGEISLAHNGVLFLDEITEFSSEALEALREPLEDKIITLSRLNQSLIYPCNFMLVAAMNPCKCGYYGSNNRKCTCTEQNIKKYLRKLSGPFLDRIDIQIEVQGLDYTKTEKNKENETSKTIRNRVIKARKIQQQRYKNEKIYSNSELNSKQCEKYCVIDRESKILLDRAYKKLSLSPRAYTKIIKIARTIADLEGENNIKVNHIAEAIQYRSLDKKYF